MSGEEVRSSLWIVLLPLFFLFGLLILLVVIPYINLSEIGVPAEYGTGVSSGIVQILPFLGVGLGIAMLFLIFAVIKRRR